MKTRCAGAYAKDKGASVQDTEVLRQMKITMSGADQFDIQNNITPRSSHGLSGSPGGISCLSPDKYGQKGSGDRLADIVLVDTWLSPPYITV